MWQKCEYFDEIIIYSCWNAIQRPDGKTSVEIAGKCINSVVLLWTLTADFSYTVNGNVDIIIAKVIMSVLE